MSAAQLASIDLGDRLRELRQFHAASRTLPPLSTQRVHEHLRGHGNDADKARANLAGLVGATSPHLKGIKSDNHITRGVGGRARPIKACAVWVDNAEHCAKIRYNEPVVRAGRPATPRGSTSFHFSFEVISKAHLELGLRTKQGKKASPSEHVTYIEREEAAAAIVDAEPSTQPSSPENFIEYQERDGALAPGAAGAGSPIITNIQGGQNDRMQLFAAIAESAKLERAPSLSISLDKPSALMDEIKREIDCGRLSEFKHGVTANSLMLSGADAEDAAAVLAALGWRDKRKKEARASRHEDAFGICHDPGKSERVQFRLVGELPHEIDDCGRSRILKRVCEEFEKRNLPYVAVMHAPDPNNDERNWHFHLVYHDRPACRFDGTAATHLMSSDANGELSQRDMASKAKWLNEPSIQAQIGLWDFQVEAKWKTKSRNVRTSHPFAQRKDRDVTRKSFVPELRALLSEFTNEELQRAGIKRRVDPLSHEKAGRKVAPGEKLFAADHARELAGIPTIRGSSNARLQSEYHSEELDIEHDRVLFEYSYLSDDERNQAEAFLGSRKVAYRMLRELADARKERATLKSLARQADNVTDELFSRPRLMTQRNQQLMLDAYSKPKSQGRVRDYARQLGHIDEHVQSMKMLGGDLLQIARDAEKSLGAVEDRIRTLEISSGLREKKSFRFDDVAITEHARAPEAAHPREVPPQGSVTDSPRVAEPQFAASKDGTSRRPNAPTTVSGEQKTFAKTPTSSMDGGRARRQAISEFIEKIYRSRIPFELKSVCRGEQTVWIASVSSSDASRHSIPVSFELETKLHENRLIGLGRERAKFARGLAAVTGHQPSGLSQPPATVTSDNTREVGQASEPGDDEIRRERTKFVTQQEHPKVQAAPESTDSATTRDVASMPIAASQPSAKRATFADRHFPRTRGQSGGIQQAAQSSSHTLTNSSEDAPSVSPPKRSEEKSIAPSVSKPTERLMADAPAEGGRDHKNVGGLRRVEGRSIEIEPLDITKRVHSDDLSRRAQEIYNRAARNAATDVADAQVAQPTVLTSAMVDIEAWRRVTASVSRGASADRGKSEAERDRLAFLARSHVIADPSLRHHLLSGERAALETQAERWTRRLRQNGLGMGLGR